MLFKNNLINFNAVQQTANEQNVYDLSKENMTPASFYSQNKPLYVGSRYFSKIYHVISAATSILGVGFVVYDMVENEVTFFTVLTALFSLALLVTMIILNEQWKGNAAKNAFKNYFIYINEANKHNTRHLILLTITTIVSIVFSAFGTFQTIKISVTEENVINKKADSTSSVINSAADSIANVTNKKAEVIRTTEKQIESLQKDYATAGNTWLKYGIANQISTLSKQVEEMRKAQNEHELKIAEMKRAEQLRAENEKMKLIESDNKKVYLYGFISIVIIIIAELLCVFAYYIEYWFYYGCAIENNFITVPTPNKINPKTPTNPTQQPKNNPTSKAGEKICPQCSTKFIAKTHLQKFCSSKCRHENWQHNSAPKIV